MSLSPTSPVLRAALLTGAVAALATGCRMTVATEVEELERTGGLERIVDRDGDGFSEDDDCNDFRADVYPGAIELCDDADNDCFGGKDDGGVCSTHRSITQTAKADVLLVLDTQEGMEGFLLDFASDVFELGDPLSGPAANVHVAVASMEPTGELFTNFSHNFVPLGSDDGAYRVAEWVRTAVEELPPAQDRGRGRDAVVALLIDSAEVDVDGKAPAPEAAMADTGAASLDVDDVAQGRESEEGPSGVFRREGAPLTVLFLSRSDDASASPIETFHKALDLTVDPDDRAVHAIVGFGERPSEGGSVPQPGPDACRGDGLVADGASYRQLAAESGGVAIDICEMKATDLRALGERIAADGLVRAHRLPGDLDDRKPVYLRAELPDGTTRHFESDDFVVDMGAWQFRVPEPPPAGSTLILSYERTPSVP